MKKGEMAITNFENGENARLSGLIGTAKHDTHVVFLYNYFLEQIVQLAEANKADFPGLQALCDYEKYVDCYEKYALGLSFYRRIPLNVILVFSCTGEKNRFSFIGYGITSTLYWDESISNLPDGWRGSVSRVFSDREVGNSPNSLVGLLISILDDYKKQGWAEEILECMRLIASRFSIANMIFPLQPPKRYFFEYANLPFEEFSSLKREDGTIEDHWIRLHVKMGAKILKCVPHSHRIIFTIEEFLDPNSDINFQSVIMGGKSIEPTDAKFSKSGQYLVCVNDRWINTYVNVENNLLLMDHWGLWVNHSTQQF